MFPLSQWESGRGEGLEARKNPHPNPPPMGRENRKEAKLFGDFLVVSQNCPPHCPLSIAPWRSRERQRRLIT